MLEGTVKQFAAALEMPVEKLIKQLEETGLSSRSAEDLLSSDEKKELLGYLRRKRGRNDESGPKKITLKRKTVSEIKLPVAGPGGARQDALQNRDRGSQKTAHLCAGWRVERGGRATGSASRGTGGASG